jgi:hypothetical protein
MGEPVQLILHQLVDILKMVGSLFLFKITERYIGFPAAFFIQRSLKIHSEHGPRSPALSSLRTECGTGKVLAVCYKAKRRNYRKFIV